jgi:hypothetical protein
MAGNSSDLYVVDASSWISIEDHPSQNLIVSRTIELIEAGRMFCPPEAWNEVKKSPRIKRLLDPYESTKVKRIQDIDYYLKVGIVASQHPAMAQPRSRKNKADPYVVAMAWYLNGTSNPHVHVVVSEESIAIRPSRKMSAACKSFGVEHLKLWQVLKREFPNDQW